MVELYEEVRLAKDIPEEGLCEGDVGTIVDFVEAPHVEAGYILEFFTPLGETLKVAVVRADAISPLTNDSVWSVRGLTRTLR